ncbi:MAG: hypothetical protein JO170_29650 [Verrucomicrobia bacterium]|nr:hypothetical protein [Verrucomicrobiota bacterium]
MSEAWFHLPVDGVNSDHQGIGYIRLVDGVTSAVLKQVMKDLVCRHPAPL